MAEVELSSISIEDDHYKILCYRYDNGLTYYGYYKPLISEELVLPDFLTEIPVTMIDEDFANINNGTIIEGQLILPCAKVIKGYAFYGQYKLTGHLYIPSTYEVIEEYAFYGCGFNRITIIPNDIIIEDHAFDGIPDCTIICYESSSAYLYAKRNNIKYEIYDPFSDYLKDKIDIII